MVVASALFVSTAVVFAASPANAFSTGSLSDEGNGGWVVTYSSPTAQDSIQVEIHTAGSSCTSPQTTLGLLTNNSGAPQSAQIAASPATIVVGTTAYAVSGGGTFTVAAASYLFCLFDLQPPNTPLAQLTMTIGQASPTTTTTTLPTTTTTLPTTTTTTAAGGVVTTSTTADGGASGDPVTPAFTG
jgi:hypothetical protein